MEILVHHPDGQESEIGGFYDHHGVHNGKVMYRKFEGASTIYFDDRWKIGVRGVDDFSFCHPDPSLSQPPSSQWAAAEGSMTDQVPTIYTVPQVLVVANISAEMNGRYVRAENVNGKPKFRQVGGSGILHFDGNEEVWKIKGAELSEDSYFHPATNALMPPTGEWRSIAGDARPNLSQIYQPISSAPRFLWVQGADGQAERVNGCYVPIGSSNGKPKYWCMGRKGIIYFRGHWKMNYHDGESGWYYQHPDTSSEFPPLHAWTTDGYMGNPTIPSLHVQQRYSEEGFQTVQRPQQTRPSEQLQDAFARFLAEDSVSNLGALASSK